VSRLPRPPLTPLLLVALVLVVGYLALTIAGSVVRDYQLRQERAALTREIAQLENDREQLINVRDYLRSDEYVEYVAQRVLGLVRPGETLVIVSSSDTAAAAAPTPEPVRTPTEWWKDLFLDPATPTPFP
jgi:cell division protein FtsB